MKASRYAAALDARAGDVLLLATGAWVSTARLTLALTSLGCVVDLMSQRGHPALMTGRVRRAFSYNSLMPLRSVRTAISEARPAVVIPVDELAVLHLEELLHGGALGAEFRELVERSLGGERVLEAARSRMTLLELARAEGVAVPDSVAVPQASDMEAAVARLGLPLVLKADATSGGRGVEVVETRAQAQAAWRSLALPPSLPRVISRAVVWKDRTHLRRWAGGQRRAVSAQRLVRGAERTAMAVAHGGEVLAVVCLEVLETWSQRGPSSVVRVIGDAVMEEAIRRVVRALGLNGFCGFDFMLDERGVPLLIEMNPRPTQLAHLPLGAGRDLVAAFVRGVLGRAVGDRPAATDKDLIALFPQELERDAHSAALREGHHDVPVECPALVEHVLRGRAM